MKVVEKATNFPAKCAISGDWDGPFLDTDTWLNARQLDGTDPYLYIHVPVVEEMGRAVGMRPKADFERLEQRVRDLEHAYAKLDAYREHIEAAEELVQNGAGI